MRGKSAILGMPLVGLVTCGTVHAAPRQPACVEIMAVCEQAGFVRGDAKAGDGLFVDCVVPILRGTPQRRRASKPLPQVDPRLVADCKVQNRRHLKQLSRQFKRTRPRLRRHHKCRRRRKSMTARNELTWIDFIWWAQTDLAVLNKPALVDL